MVFHWSKSDNKPFHVFRTFLSILVDLNGSLEYFDSPIDFKFLQPLLQDPGYRS